MWTPPYVSNLSCLICPSLLELRHKLTNAPGWAISTGAQRNEIQSVSDLKDSKIGVSRIGSGSYVMGTVLADQQGWLTPGTAPFTFKPLESFAKLRDGVNDKTVDFFMWEHFTSKRYYDNGEIKRVGEIYTPWSSWLIVASTKIDKSDQRLQGLFESLDKGIKHFLENEEEAVKYIYTSLDYSEEDAREWLKTVKFSKGVRGTDETLVQKVRDTLLKAGVVGESGLGAQEMVAIRK
jgi:ABC-type nitrate/sulfonate/bicarbonate transport system substrate-binding protein